MASVSLRSRTSRGGKNREVLRHMDAGRVKFEKLDLPRAGSGAKDDAERRAFRVLALVLGQPAKVELHLPDVMRSFA